MKITYFDSRGLADVTRCMFKMADVPFEDDRLASFFTRPGDFTTITCPEFDRRKQNCEFETSMNKLPLFVTSDGTQFGQSKAIERYVARTLGYMGTTEVECAQIDAICEHIRDLKDSYTKAKLQESLKAWCAGFIKDTILLNDIIPIFLKQSSTPTLAHIALYNFYYDIIDTEMCRKALETCTTLRSMCNMIKYNPRIVDWEKHRPNAVF